MALEKRMKPTISRCELPYDIIFSILCKSTVKSLMRFICVSKSINSLIKSSTFIAAQHRNQIRINDNDISDSYVVQMPNDDTEDQELCSLTRKTNEPSQKYTLPFPFRCYVLVGACEGLICFAKDSNVYIWNPFVGSMKIVPPSGSKNSNVVYRFDFAKRICDYKVIKQIIGDDILSITLEIYSLATDSWRRIQYDVRPSCFVFFKVQILSKRSIYWMKTILPSRYGLPNAAVRFDLDEETFEEVGETTLYDTMWYISLLFNDTWNGVLEGDQERHAFLAYQPRVRIQKEYHLVPLKESLTLFDQKDENLEAKLR